MHIIRIFIINIQILQGWKALSRVVVCILGYLKGLRDFLIKDNLVLNRYLVSSIRPQKSWRNTDVKKFVLLLFVSLWNLRNKRIAVSEGISCEAL